jgi:hypothetical protein
MRATTTSSTPGRFTHGGSKEHVFATVCESPRRQSTFAGGLIKRKRLARSARNEVGGAYVSKEDLIHLIRYPLMQQRQRRYMLRSGARNSPRPSTRQPIIILLLFVATSSTTASRHTRCSTSPPSLPSLRHPLHLAPPLRPISHPRPLPRCIRSPSRAPVYPSDRRPRPMA